MTVDQKNRPVFAAWSHANLATFAEEAYTRLQLQYEAIEQLRNDLRAAMALTRKHHQQEDDWK